MNSLYSGRERTSSEDAIKAEAIVAWHGVCARQLRDEQDFQCLPINHGCAVSLPGAPGAVFNRVLGCRRPANLRKAYRWMSARAGTRFLQLDQEAASDDVRRWIEARTLVEQGPAWAKLVRGRRTDIVHPPGDTAYRKVHSGEAALFESLICNGFSLPETLIPIWASIVGKEGWSCFFALDGDMPIGTGALYSSGTRGWLGGGTVLPAFRHRGAQKALIHARLEQGEAKGVSTFVVEATLSSPGNANISYDNLRKVGFEHVYTRRNFVF